jgi:hypothetical protein
VESDGLGAVLKHRPEHERKLAGGRASAASENHRIIPTKTRVPGRSAEVLFLFSPAVFSPADYNDDAIEEGSCASEATKGPLCAA